MNNWFLGGLLILGCYATHTFGNINRYEVKEVSYVESSGKAGKTGTVRTMSRLDRTTGEVHLFVPEGDIWQPTRVFHFTNEENFPVDD